MSLPVAIQHVIGTVSILLLSISIGVSFNNVASFVQTDVSKKEMNQIATHVSLNLVEVATLTNSSGYTLTLVKTIGLPSDIGGKAYFVQLVDATSQDKGYLVKVTLRSQRGVSVESFLPINSTSIVSQMSVVNNRNPAWGDTVPGSRPTVTYTTDLDGTVDAVVYGGNNAVVWARQEENMLYMGIGYLK